MKFYGAAYHSVSAIKKWLGKQGVTENMILVIGDNATVPARTSKKILIFLNKATLARNKKALRAPVYTKKQVFLLEDPITLIAYDNVTLIDCAKGKELLEEIVVRKRLGNFKLGDCEGDFPIRSKRPPLTNELIEKVKERGSILNAFMSLVYTLSSATHQKPVKTGICHWFFYGGSAEQLTATLNIVQAHAPMSDSIRQRITAILVGDTGAKYTKAFKLVRATLMKKQDVDYDALAAEYSISAYDMRYIRSIVSNHEKLQNAERVIGLEVLKLLKVPKNIQLQRAVK